MVGLQPTTLAAGSAVTAVILGLAAQQTLGNVFAGAVLLAARPFAAGDWVRLRSGGVGGEIEGHVDALGLLYTSMTGADGAVQVPNGLVLNSAIVAPSRAPAAEVRVRLPVGMTTGDLRQLLESHSLGAGPDSVAVALEELGPHGTVVRVNLGALSAAERVAVADEVAAGLAEFVSSGRPGSASTPESAS